MTTDRPPPSTSTEALRPVRSFVRREGRLTQGQRRALQQLLDRYAVPDTAVLDPAVLFGPGVPVVMDIGFGNGSALVELARSHPGRGYLGVEVYRPGVGGLLQRLEQEGIPNVRVACADAVELLARRVPEASLAGVQLFFPDPWPKKRHHKRRMVQPDWASLVARRLAPGGFLHLATDCSDYAQWMLEVLEGCPELVNASGRGRFAPGPCGRPDTRFQRRGEARGHPVRDLIYRRLGLVDSLIR